VDPNTKLDETITAGQKITLKTAFPAGYQPTAHPWALGGKEPVSLTRMGASSFNSLQGSIPAGTT
jgi:hypothetical protein